MENIQKTFETMWKVVPIICMSIITAMLAIFLEEKHKKTKILEVEKTYFDLSNIELLNIYMDISHIISNIQMLTQGELFELYYIMENYRLWCLDLHDFDKKYHCCSSMYYYINQFRTQYGSIIDTEHNFEYVELNANNIIERIQKIKINII